MNMKVRLLKNVEAEGALFPAGTVCEIEQAYPAQGDVAAMVDLVEPVTGTLFWTFADEVADIEMDAP